MHRLEPITNNEFLGMLKRCKPPPGWSDNLAVANSGGPDSTCLLFLLHRCLSEQRSPIPELPHSLTSLTVNHNLQTASIQMAKHCETFARRLRTPHLTTTIQWGQSSYPVKPLADEAFEKTARDVRYHALFRAMTQSSIPVIAFAHHADDQVETSLMRLARGSTILGAAGMRRVRRWGMGSAKDPNGLDRFGYDGLSKWIIRPLLDIPKGRILTTCDENRLEYVNDPTNFQPAVTLRNAVRQMLDRMDSNCKDSSSDSHANSAGSGDRPLSPHISQEMENIGKGMELLLPFVSADILGVKNRFRYAAQTLASQLEDVDREVDNLLDICRLPSPPGTFLLPSASLSTADDLTVRRAFVLRVMRYVSFHPWGSPKADGKRRQTSHLQIIRNLWTPHEIVKLRPFVAGGGVLWTPVIIGRNGNLKRCHRHSQCVGKEKHLGWIASRQPPTRRESLDMDVTQSLLDARTEDVQDVSFLYDARFLIRVDVKMMPANIFESINAGGKIIVQPSPPWLSPAVIWKRREGDSEALRYTMADEATVSQGKVEVVKIHPREENCCIKIKWIRPVSAL